MKRIASGHAGLTNTLSSLFDDVSGGGGQTPEEILTHALKKTIRVMGGKAGNIRIYDSGTGNLRLAASHGVSARYRNYKKALHLHNSAAGRVFIKQEVYIAGNLANNGFYFHPEYAADEGIRSLICLPLTARGRKIGVFSVYFSGARKFSKCEVDFLSMLVKFLASYMANLILEKEVGKGHLDLAKVLIKMLEEKDAYTRGHSERVRDYAINIGEKLRLDEKDFRALADFSVLHDIGKVTIDSNILNSPNKLTESEWEQVKEHPLVGERILRSVDGFSSSIPIIKHHHERPDGKGYPDGLKGEEIPLLARIVAVCDSFDAMVSMRAYRDALSIEKAKQELLENAGTQFDARIAGIMAGMIESGEVRVPGDEEDSVQFMAGGVGIPSFQASVFPGRSTASPGIGFDAYFKP